MIAARTYETTDASASGKRAPTSISTKSMNLRLLPCFRGVIDVFASLVEFFTFIQPNFIKNERR